MKIRNQISHTDGFIHDCIIIIISSILSFLVSIEDINVKHSILSFVHIHCFQFCPTFLWFFWGHTHTCSGITASSVFRDHSWSGDHTYVILANKPRSSSFQAHTLLVILSLQHLLMMHLMSSLSLNNSFYKDLLSTYNARHTLYQNIHWHS